MNEKIEAIKKWLGTGSINIFGLPMCGKDTVGVRLAEDLGARFLSSGMIIRAMEEENNNHMSDSGELIPTDVFYEWILPYFSREDLRPNALVLSSVGRWSGEETEVMKSAKEAGHEIKVAIHLEVPEEEVKNRWHTLQEIGDSQRAGREDDKDEGKFQIRINEFNEKTRPVLDHYNELGLLTTVSGVGERDAVYNAVIDAIFARIAQ